MKKIGIITLLGNNNFGNKLQNYALCTYLNKMGLKSETIKFKSLYNENFLYTILMRIKYGIIKKEKISKRKEKFLQFDSRYIVYSDKIIKWFSNLKKINDDYDYFIVGSDQVWNYKMTHNFNLFFLEKFDYDKKVAYSASFGISKIDNKFKKRVKKDLNSIKSISVREQQGKEIILELTNREDVEVLIDPTMLLSDKEWKKVAKKPSNYSGEKYILNYFLGDMKKEREEEIKKIAIKNNCKIINVLDKNDPYYNIGPQEFLFLEENAFLICTDSFHACVFSILFNKPFVVFERENSKNNMSSRVETLLKKFNLKDREYNGIFISDKNLLHNYTEAYNILEMERKKSFNFLKRALDCENI